MGEAVTGGPSNTQYPVPYISLYSLTLICSKGPAGHGITQGLRVVAPVRNAH